MPAQTPNRRDLLTGRAVRMQAEAAQDALADALLDDAGPHDAGSTIRLAARAMGTEFGVLMNPGPASQVAPASEALALVARLERQLTVYRDDSEVSRLNANAADGPVAVEENLFRLLSRCGELASLANGAFDPATQAQILLWRQCRLEDRVPTDEEIDTALARSGMRHVRFDAENRTVAFDRAGVGFNLGAIGKGYALDRCADILDVADRAATVRERSSGALDAEPLPDGRGSDASLTAFCLHGGHSSVLARGDHNGLGGWPVGIGNPLFTSRRLGTILLKDRSLGTSGSNIQFYRHEGTRYGHILDPRTARPAGELLSVTVLAPTAADADALSTAFYVLGVEKAREICDNDSLIGALLIPPPRRGGRLEPVVLGLSEDTLYLDPDQATVAR